MRIRRTIDLYQEMRIFNNKYDKKSWLCAKTIVILHCQNTYDDNISIDC